MVSFWVSKPRKPGEPSGRRVFEYEPQRDLQLALSEYAPTRSLTIDKWRFESAALFSPYEPSPAPTLARRQPYTACRSCTFVSLDAAAASLALCPCCGSDQVAHAFFITPAGLRAGHQREARGRSRAADHLRGHDGPGATRGAGPSGRLAPRALRRAPEDLDRAEATRGREQGRGRPRLPRVPGLWTFRAGVRTRLHADQAHSRGNAGPAQAPLEQGAICTGIADGPFYLGHRFPTDALLLRLNVASPVRLGTATTPGLLSRAARMALSSLVEAIALAASRELQIDEGELSGWWAPVLGGRTDEAQLYLYDLLPGGAGYARAVGEALDGVLDATERLLADCDCASVLLSVHSSLREQLHSRLAGSPPGPWRCLRHVRHGTTPAVLGR